MRVLEDRIKQFVSDNNFYVLRDRRTGKALNVSYTEEGLKYTMSNYGKLLYFANAKLVRHENKLAFSGDTRKSNRVVVEKFVPTDSRSLRVQISEIQ